jgi:hypothetical protein
MKSMLFSHILCLRADLCFTFNSFLFAFLIHSYLQKMITNSRRKCLFREAEEPHHRLPSTGEKLWRYFKIENDDDKIYLGTVKKPTKDGHFCIEYGSRCCTLQEMLSTASVHATRRRIHPPNQGYCGHGKKENGNTRAKRKCGIRSQPPDQNKKGKASNVQGHLRELHESIDSHRKAKRSREENTPGVLGKTKCDSIGSYSKSNALENQILFREMVDAETLRGIFINGSSPEQAKLAYEGLVCEVSVLNSIFRGNESNGIS